jgi:hypothetical protein
MTTTQQERAARVRKFAYNGYKIGEHHPSEEWIAGFAAAFSASESERADRAEGAAKSWKHHWQMYRDAWVRELGGWTIPKSHEIDSLVLTTRKRCVNPLLGNCGTPHWLGKPTEDGKALQQNTHPRDNYCQDWKCDSSEPNLRAEEAEKRADEAERQLAELSRLGSSTTPETFGDPWGGPDSHGNEPEAAPPPTPQMEELDWHLFHRLWTKAVDNRAYNKQEWMKLEGMLIRLERQHGYGAETKEP